MYITLTDLDGDAILINSHKIKFIFVRRHKGIKRTCVCIDDRDYFGFSSTIMVQEPINEVLVQLQSLQL